MTSYNNHFNNMSIQIDRNKDNNISNLMGFGMNLSKNFFAAMFAVIAVWSMAISNAVAMTAPDEVVKTTISKALKELNDRRGELANNRAELYATVERVLEPSIHFERVSKLVLAKHWRKASPAQQKEFTAEFKKSLLQTYATAVFDYSGEEIVYLPYKSDGKDKAKIKTEFVTKAGNRIPVIYSMSNRGDKSWRMYDIKIITDGAATSLVQLYKSQYGSIIEAKGIDGLLTQLKQKNASLN